MHSDCFGPQVNLIYLETLNPYEGFDREIAEVTLFWFALHLQSTTKVYYQ